MLSEQHSFTLQSAKQLKGFGANDDQILVGDILDASGSALLDKAVAGCDALVIATSAVPKIKPLSLIKAGSRLPGRLAWHRADRIHVAAQQHIQHSSFSS